MQLFHEVELNASGQALYELCVQAIGVARKPTCNNIYIYIYIYILQILMLLIIIIVINENDHNTNNISITTNNE